MVDKRKKGCPNQECVQHIMKKMMKPEYFHCPICGEPLIYVCSKCFDEIEDLGPKHTICRNCEIEAKQKRDEAVEKAKNGAKKAGGAAIAFGGAVFVGIYTKVLKESKGNLINKGAELVKNATKMITKS